MNIYRFLAALGVTFVLVACGTESRNTLSEAQMMDSGLARLRAGDNAAAEQQFRSLLERNPTHYGAHYQLAVALDRGGKPTDARLVWDQVRVAAEAAKDSATLATVRARLAAPDTVSLERVMQSGLDLLYKDANPTGASEKFREVLKRNPTHYGATFQLAKALDLAGQRAQATPLWQKVLGMAVSYKDQQTIDAARARLKTP